MIMKNKEVRITTLIGQGAVCNGDFSAEGSVRIDGVVNGNVTITGALIVGAAGTVNGDVSAKSAMIGGEIVGNVTVTDKTELTGTARVLGNISTAVIVIDENAVFQGNCNMNQSEPERRPRPVGRATRAGKRSAKAAIEEALKEMEEADREENDSSGQNSTF